MTGSGARIRVLVVDDSAFARKVIREVLSGDQRIDVVDIARDGLEALEKISQLAPDVVTLDLVMPNLDGVGVLRALPAGRAPRVVVVSMSDAESALGLEALHSGAVDVVHKPTALATERLYEIGQQLIDTVVAAAEARVVTLDRSNTPVSARPEAAVVRRATQLVAIGTSTGGPQALTRLLSALPADFPVPIAIALHIPEGYTQGLAARLNGVGPLAVSEARPGMVLTAGQVVLAPGGSHLRIARGPDGPVCQVTRALAADAARHVPSVNALFESAAAALGDKLLAVVLTGMGDDGLEGARCITQAGGLVLGESETSCVVYGMPRCVKEAGLTAAVAPLEHMAKAILGHL
jgi:two-component system, chemotaxis family, protein-glutamate methylesterase/glutaminase